jgi:pSer/pThr/pTyr-binding forkhead associated (FHA) protein
MSQSQLSQDSYQCTQIELTPQEFAGPDLWGTFVPVPSEHGDKGAPRIEFLVEQDKYVFGRSSECDKHCLFTQKFVGRKHLVVSHDAATGLCHIKDTSANGTYVNGMRLQKDHTVIMNHGDEISLVVNSKGSEKEVSEAFAVFIFQSPAGQMSAVASSAFGSAPPGAGVAGRGSPSNSDRDTPVIAAGGSGTDQQVTAEFSASAAKIGNGRSAKPAAAAADLGMGMGGGGGGSGGGGGGKAVAQANTRSLEESYDVLEVLGSGTYAQVHRCVHRDTGQEFAVKVIQVRGIEGQMLHHKAGAGDRHPPLPPHCGAGRAARPRRTTAREEPLTALVIPLVSAAGSAGQGVLANH